MSNLIYNTNVLFQGMILLWDVDSGLAQLDKYFHSNDNHVIAGALLGVGIVNCSIKNDCDPVSFFYPYVFWIWGGIPLNFLVYILDLI